MVRALLIMHTRRLASLAGLGRIIAGAFVFPDRQLPESCRMQCLMFGCPVSPRWMAGSPRPLRVVRLNLPTVPASDSRSVLQNAFRVVALIARIVRVAN